VECDLCKLVRWNPGEDAWIPYTPALDIDKLDRGRTDQPHKRMPEYEALLKKLREELRAHMSGSVMVAGQGWALATDVNEK